MSAILAVLAIAGLVFVVGYCIDAKQKRMARQWVEDDRLARLEADREEERTGRFVPTMDHFWSN